MFIHRNQDSTEMQQKWKGSKLHVIWHRNLATPKRSVFRNCRAGFWFGFGSRSCRWYTFVWWTRNLLWESEKNHTWQFLVSLPACLYLQLRCPFLDTSPCLRAGCKLFFTMPASKIASDMHQSYKSPNMNSKSTGYITFQELSWNLSPQTWITNLCSVRSIPVASFGVARPQPMMPPDIHRWSSPSPIHMAGCLADEMWTGQTQAKSCELHNLDMKLGRRVMARNTSKLVL